MTREELQQNVEVARTAFKAEYAKAEQHTNGIVQRWLNDLGITDAKVVNTRANEYFEIGVAKDGNYRHHTFDLYFEKNWREEERKFRMNVATFGTFAPSDLPECKYYIAVGKIAEHSAEIERDLLNFDWKRYDEVQMKFYEEKYKLENFDREQKKIEEEQKKNEFRRMIRVGAKVNCGKRHRWSETEDVKTIENVTAKNVVFAEDWGHRTKIEELLVNLIAGSWKFVA